MTVELTPGYIRATQDKGGTACKVVFLRKDYHPFVHTTEQYITYPVDARFQDRIAEGILQTLIEIGETTVAEPENYEARANLVWSATMALNGVVGEGFPRLGQPI